MKCTECGAEVEHIDCTVNPREAVREFTTNCGHLISEDAAHAAWRDGVTVGPMLLPQVEGATLIGAERRRHVAEEGHTAEADADLVGDQLAWAAWCLLDRATAKNPPEQAPPVWPLPLDRWPADKTPLRRLIIAGSFIAAEIDRLLAAGETP